MFINVIPTNIKGWVKNGAIQILCHNFALRYDIRLNFGRNTTSIALNSKWYNLVLMLQCKVFWKAFHKRYLLTEISSFLSQSSFSFK